MAPAGMSGSSSGRVQEKYPRLGLRTRRPMVLQVALLFDLTLRAKTGLFFGSGLGALEKSPQAGGGKPYRILVRSHTFANRFAGFRGSTPASVRTRSHEMAAIATENVVSVRIIRSRGGNDFFSGTLAGSMTLTVGISLAS